MASTNDGAIPKPVRCAIYTPKSTDEGLGQDFNSLDAQREAAEAYIASQKHDGWTVVPSQCSDGGYTGANIERPGVAATACRHRGWQGRLRGCVQG